MRKLLMVDLVAQYQKIQPEIDKTLLGIFPEATFVGGIEVKSFEIEFADFLQSKYVIACGNGTDAIQIALMSLGLKPGDEVITSDFTFIATVEAAALLGLKPVLVDVDSRTFNIDLKKFEEAITEKTKAVIPVHLFGQCADMEPLIRICQKHNIYIVEDTAQAIGADYTFSNGEKRKAGTIGHIGTTSFYPTKNLGCYGDGGAIFTNDDALAVKIRSMANHGMAHERYYYDDIGVNSRLDSMQAAILRVKLRQLKSYQAARQEAAAYYNSKFAGQSNIEIPFVAANSDHVYHQYTLKIKNGDRDALKTHLDSKGIPNAIHYPVPLHSQAAYKQFGFRDEDFPVTNQLCKDVISLPMHTELDHEQMDFIISEVLNFVNR